MFVLTTPRRITLYWLLLLVSTLAVGGGALFLLWREHARLAARSAEADEARQAALTARARLVVETVELYIGDAQTGLLDVLAAEPTEGLDEFMGRWEKDNPLVRTAFRATADGRVLRPDPRTGEEARGFARRFSQEFGGGSPWGFEGAGKLQKATAPEQKRQQDEAELRREVGPNVSQAQLNRRDVQELVKAPEYSNSFNNMSRNSAAPAVSSAPAGVSSSARAGETASANEQGLGNFSDALARAAKAKTEVDLLQAKFIMPDKRGWSPWTVDGRLHVMGWLQPGGAGDVRGVELELAALISRLASALPAEVGAGEGYALRDEQGRVMHQVGSIPRNGGRLTSESRDPAPTVRVPLATAVLPGWDVAAYYAVPAYKMNEGDAGFFWAGALLGAVFLAAILAGGWLLLWQARRSEAEAAQKTSFVANVSHEFKTPLTTIRLYAELLEQGRVRDAAQGGDYLRTIGRETQRLARLVNNALDFSRLEQGKKKYAREALDVGAELARLLDTHAPRVAEAGLELKRDLPAAPLPLATDRDALEQIVLNLIDNACKYAAEGGEVRVSAAPWNGGVAIRVADRGPGVPEEHRERIFEKFHRVDDALTAEKTGAGLGLSIARQLARGLGGEVYYTSREGGGAEFVLELPA